MAMKTTFQKKRASLLRPPLGPIYHPLRLIRRSKILLDKTNNIPKGHETDRPITLIEQWHVAE
ncbi:uncharacterized protein METZ01_LOCUS373872, partial [marine metagenome]